MASGFLTLLLNKTYRRSEKRRKPNRIFSTRFMFKNYVQTSLIQMGNPDTKFLFVPTFYLMDKVSVLSKENNLNSKIFFHKIENESNEIIRMPGQSQV